MYEQMRPTYGRRPQPWMVLHHNRDARLATVLKPWAPSAGWSSDEPIRKGSTTRSSPVGPNGLMGSSRHCHFLTWGRTFGFFASRTGLSASHRGKRQKSTIHQNRKEKRICNWFGLFTHLSWSMSFFFVASNIEGAELWSRRWEDDTGRANGWTLATGRHSWPCDRRG